MKNFSYSVVILSYNHPELTEKTLLSVLNQGYPNSCVILVHNGSEPRHAHVLVKAYPEVQHVIIEKNKGYSGGANEGLREAFKKSERVLFLTNDIEIISMPQAFPSGDILAPRILKRNTGQVDSVMGVLDCRTGRLKHARSLDDLKVLQQHELIYPPGTAFGITKTCFEALNGFDEAFHTYWEDVDFGLRAQQKSFVVAHAEGFCLRHKIGKTCHKHRFYTLYLFQRNRRRLMRKHGFAGVRFFGAYFCDLTKLLWRIAVRPRPWAPLKLWWKVIYD